MEVICYPVRTVKAFKGCIDRGYGNLKITGTRDGTGVGIRSTKDHFDLAHADFEAENSYRKVQGKLNLDYLPYALVAEVDPATLVGERLLEILQ